MLVFNLDVGKGLLFGGLISVIGLVATAQNIRSANGPKERVFVAWSNLVAWIGMALFFTVLFFVPQPYRYLLLILYFAIFPFVVYRFCSRRLLIRRLESIKAAAAQRVSRAERRGE